MGKKRTTQSKSPRLTLTDKRVIVRYLEWYVETLRGEIAKAKGLPPELRQAMSGQILYWENAASYLDHMAKVTQQKRTYLRYECEDFLDKAS